MVMESLIRNDAFGSSNSAFMSPQTYSHKPLLNESSAIIKAPLTTTTRPADFAKFLIWFRKTPECVSLISALVTDILSDGWRFEGAKTNRVRAESFMQDNSGYSQLEAWLYDFLTFGNGFIFKGKPTREKVKELAKLFVKYRKIKNKEFVCNFLTKNLDEQSYGGRMLQTLPASTMNITPSDKFGTYYTYSQRVGTSISSFDEKDVVHIKDLNINGEMWGMARFEAVLSETTLLGMLKDYYGHQLDNYGVPPGVFSFPDEQPNSPNVMATKALLKEGKKIDNKNRVWVTSGNIVYTTFDRMTDMEFKNLSQYLTLVLGMVYHVPPSRWGGTGQKNEEASLSVQAYERNIKHIRTKIEDAINTQLFVKFFKVTFKFNESHFQDEVRFAQSTKILTDVAEQRMRLTLWSKESAAKFLKIDPEDMGKGKPNYGSKYNQVMGGNKTLKNQGSVEVDRKKRPKNRNAGSDVRAEGEQ